MAGLTEVGRLLVSLCPMAHISALPEQPEVVRGRPEATVIAAWHGWLRMIGVASVQVSGTGSSLGMIGRLEGWQRPRR